MQIDLVNLRNSLGLSQREMSQICGVSRAYYINAEKKGWLQDNIVFSQHRAGHQIINLPDEFLSYTSASLLLNMIAKGILCPHEGHGGARNSDWNHTQASLAAVFGVSQPYMSMLLNRDTCFYDLKETLDRIFDPYLVPFYRASDGSYVRYVTDDFSDEALSVHSNGRDPYSATAVGFNIRIRRARKQDLASYLGCGTDILRGMLTDNCDFAPYADQLQKYFKRFYVPFNLDPDSGRYRMLEAGENPYAGNHRGKGPPATDGSRWSTD